MNNKKLLKQQHKLKILKKQIILPQQQKRKQKAEATDWQRQTLATNKKSKRQ